MKELPSGVFGSRFILEYYKYDAALILWKRDYFHVTLIGEQLEIVAFLVFSLTVIKAKQETFNKQWRSISFHFFTIKLLRLLRKL